MVVLLERVPSKARLAGPGGEQKRSVCALLGQKLLIAHNSAHDKHAKRKG